MQYKHSTSLNNNKEAASPQSGSVFTVLLAGIAIASALSYTLYQILSGPLSSMVRVTNKTSAQIGAQTAISTVVTDAISTFGDCDSDGSIYF